MEGILMSSINQVTVLGTGILGAQIIFQTAFKGFHVTAYDISDDLITQAKQSFSHLAEVYLKELPGTTRAATQAALDRISTTSDLSQACKEADLIIEAAPEIIELKQKLYAQIASLAPEHAILATNSSTLLPSTLAPSTGRQDRFIALHFANTIWIHNTAEIMGTDQTSRQTKDKVIEFAKNIGMVPIVLNKEKSGYVLNSLLIPLLNAAGFLVSEGYADPETVDKTWKIATDSPLGPFEIYDVVGLKTAYNIIATAGKAGDEKSARLSQYIKENYLDKGKFGIASGEGFYKYPRQS
ncbi:3-hydroxyacyl-CoA dehydrogenase [Bifidobacterium aquikefiri]|uniref:3-hydroxyacyl-CoA dehydrogenase n=1 Tax=Bifidobacterium aquikefiri TaxID=1653207 RepID=UPI0023F42AB0|nr:3-hydroxyacyl-CoA dehydrogenase [Bifidobacterium aquikefiri]